MNNQIKYVVQGILLTLFAILIFCFVSFISSVRFTELGSSFIDYGDIAKPSQDIRDKTIEGQDLFYANCASCHAIRKRLTGPALAGFEKRGPWKDKKQLYAWIRNPEKYMKNNTYTKQLYKEYQVLMTPFPNLTNKEIDAIVNCINQTQVQYDSSYPVAFNKKR